MDLKKLKKDELIMVCTELIQENKLLKDKFNKDSSEHDVEATTTLSLKFNHNGRILLKSFMLRIGIPIDEIIYNDIGYPIDVKSDNILECVDYGDRFHVAELKSRELLTSLFRKNSKTLDKET